MCSNSISETTALIPFYPNFQDLELPKMYPSEAFKVIYHDIINSNEENTFLEFQRNTQLFGRKFNIILESGYEIPATFLHIAAKKGHARITDLIVRKFPNLLDFEIPGNLDSKKYRPLEYVIRETTDSVSARIVPILLKGINYEFIKKYAYSPRSMYSRELNDKEIQKLLIDNPSTLLTDVVKRNGIEERNVSNFIFQTAYEGKILTFKSILNFYTQENQQVFSLIQDCTIIPNVVVSIIHTYCRPTISDLVTLTCANESLMQDVNPMGYGYPSVINEKFESIFQIFCSRFDEPFAHQFLIETGKIKTYIEMGKLFSEHVDNINYCPRDLTFDFQNQSYSITYVKEAYETHPLLPLGFLDHLKTESLDNLVQKVTTKNDRA